MSTPSGIRPVLLLVLGLLSALTPFAIDMYLPSIPAIARDLGADVELVQLSITVYLAVFAAAQLVLGPLSDVHGRRRIIGLGLLVFMLANIGCALAPSMEVRLLARAVEAVGGAAVGVTVPALVRDLFDRDNYARIMCRPRGSDRCSASISWRRCCLRFSTRVWCRASAPSGCCVSVLPCRG